MSHVFVELAHLFVVLDGFVEDVIERFSALVFITWTLFHKHLLGVVMEIYARSSRNLAVAKRKGLSSVLYSLVGQGGTPLDERGLGGSTRALLDVTGRTDSTAVSHFCSIFYLSGLRPVLLRSRIHSSQSLLVRSSMRRSLFSPFFGFSVLLVFYFRSLL